MYKIVAIDADGTLLDDKGRIPEQNKAAVAKAQRAGAFVTLCSGRSVVSLRRFAAELGLDPALSAVISFQGSITFDGAYNVMRDIRMDRDAALSVIRAARPFGMTAVVYMETDVMLCEERDRDAAEVVSYTKESLVRPAFVRDFTEAVTKDPYKVLYFGQNDELKRISGALEGLCDGLPCGMVFSSKQLLEFSHVDANKGSALRELCETLGFDIARDAVAIGDSFNDLSMIEAAAIGVCMKNGEDAVKAAADYVTKNDNRNAGVAEVIGRFITRI